MTALRLPLAALALLALTGMARQNMLSVRFHVEASPEDGPTSSVPVKLTNPPRASFMYSIPDISERNIVAIYPVLTSPGSWGCAFKLDEDGRLKLESLSREKRGKSLIMLVQTKGGTHQVINVTIDKPVTDGILYIPGGLTSTEMGVMLKEFHTFGSPPATPVPVKIKKHWWS